MGTQKDLMYGLGQTKKKKESEAKVRTTKSNLKDVNITETMESNARKYDFDREKNEKAAIRDTQSKLKDVTITDTIESTVRKDQNEREKEWKETGKQQKKS